MKSGRAVIKRSRLKNAGLLKIESCMNKIVNVIPEEIDSLILIVDQFLKSHKNEYKVNQLMDKLYTILDSIIILDSKKKVTKKVKDDDKNYIMIKKKIGEGNYAVINRCVINNKSFVVKIAKFNKNNKDEVTIDFLKENLIHIILFCFHDLMNKCFKISSVDRCIPEIVDLVKSSDEKNKNDKLIVVMEELDSDGEKFFSKKKPYKDELKFIALVAYNIYFLQKSVKQFIHRDMHAKNIMIKKTEKSKTKIVVMEGRNKFSFDVESDYRTYLIDFGMSCFDLASCLKLLNMPVSKISSPGSYRTNYCDNRSHDMRLFLCSIYENGYPLSDNLNNWLDELFEGYYLKEGFWGMYEQVLKIKDPNFYPENILKKISQELNDLS